MITVILKFQTKHTDDIIAIFYEASLLAHPFLEQTFLEQEKRNIREIYLAHVETWVLMDEGKVIGFISLLEKEVMALFVEPGYHGRGHGKALMDKAVALAGDLEVVVFKENARGRGFYKNYGFSFMSEFIHEATGQSCLRLSYREPVVTPT